MAFSFNVFEVHKNDKNLEIVYIGNLLIHLEDQRTTYIEVICGIVILIESQRDLIKLQRL